MSYCKRRNRTSNSKLDAIEECLNKNRKEAPLTRQVFQRSIKDIPQEKPPSSQSEVKLNNIETRLLKKYFTGQGEENKCENNCDQKQSQEVEKKEEVNDLLDHLDCLLKGNVYKKKSTKKQEEEETDRKKSSCSLTSKLENSNDCFSSKSGQEESSTRSRQENKKLSKELNGELGNVFGKLNQVSDQDSVINVLKEIAANDHLVNCINSLNQGQWCPKYIRRNESAENKKYQDSEDDFEDSSSQSEILSSTCYALKAKQKKQECRISKNKNKDRLSLPKKYPSRCSTQENSKNQVKEQCNGKKGSKPNSSQFKEFNLSVPGSISFVSSAINQEDSSSNPNSENWQDELSDSSVGEAYLDSICNFMIDSLRKPVFIDDRNSYSKAQ